MRLLGGALIRDAWNNGRNAIGKLKPHGVVTVEKDWYLNQVGDIRWWQHIDGNGIETEVPNIENISIDRTIDQDAQQCTITLSNQWHYVNGEIALGDETLGQPGYFTFSRGESQESQDRWGQTRNEWNNVLIPDALLRTYQGYGGHNKTLDEALIDGNVVLTGVWLIDEVRVNAKAKIEIRCRDMAKLLVEQQIYPPLVPADRYPVVYSRWGFNDMGSDDTFISIIPSPPLSFTFLGPQVNHSATGYGGNVPQPSYPDYFWNEPGNGYWLLSTNGDVWAFGNKVYYGGAVGIAQWEHNASVEMCSTITGHGYWIICENGTVVARGDAVHYGNAGSYSPCVAIDMHYTGRGYWVLHRDGTVEGFGVATNLGGISTNLGPAFTDPAYIAAVDIAADPVGNGYWILDNWGKIVNHGSADFFGNAYLHYFPDPNQDPDAGPVRTNTRITAHPLGGGYWQQDQVGQVFAFGRAKHYGQLAGQAYVALGGHLPYQNANFPDFMNNTVPTPSGKGYWLPGVSGGVYPFGDATTRAPLLGGGANGPFESSLRIDGNYTDYTDIVRELLLWSGFYLGGTFIDVYGNLETTGAFASDRLPQDMFDKQPVIDPINKIKEIVGYIFYVDDEGAVHFESPNIYAPGNFDELGIHSDTIPEIDEEIQLFDYSVNFTDKSARSEIIISTTDPTEALDDTVTTRITPSTSDLLRGMTKPAMWVNGIFTSEREQEIMAELIALYSWLAQRQGSVSIMANPCLQINDQVRIFERVTSESYIHYIRGISSQMDLIGGEYTMTLTTHWMGDDTVWAVDLGLEPFEWGVGYQRELTYNFSTSDLDGSEPGTETLDGNLATFWSVPGNNGQVISTAVEYIEYLTSGTINRVGVYAFGARIAYISVMEGGVWQGGSTIPYDPLDPPGPYSGANDPEIPYVAVAFWGFVEESDSPLIVDLGGTYDAERIRITLSSFEDSDWGPYYYKGGIREVAAGLA